MNFTAEQIAKAKAAKSAEELLAFSKECNFALTEDEAKFYFGQWHREGELADKELSDVSGGSQCVDGKTYSSDYPYYLIVTAGNSCPLYRYREDDPLTFDIGTCPMCEEFLSKIGSLIMYCGKRTVDNDPYR